MLHILLKNAAFSRMARQAEVRTRAWSSWLSTRRWANPRKPQLPSPMIKLLTCCPSGSVRYQRTNGILGNLGIQALGEWVPFSIYFIIKRIKAKSFEIKQVHVSIFIISLGQIKNSNHDWDSTRSTLNEIEVEWLEHNAFAENREKPYRGRA